jgi:hypothetical protein
MAIDKGLYSIAGFPIEQVQDFAFFGQGNDAFTVKFHHDVGVDSLTDSTIDRSLDRDRFFTDAAKDLFLHVFSGKELKQATAVARFNERAETLRRAYEFTLRDIEAPVMDAPRDRLQGINIVFHARSVLSVVSGPAEFLHEALVSRSYFFR